MKLIFAVHPFRFITIFILSLSAFSQAAYSNNVSIKENIVANTEQNTVRFIQITIEELMDNSGLKYIGGKVHAADLSIYLNQLEQKVGKAFYIYRENQSMRDKHSFHVTLINPFEYELLKDDVQIGKQLRVSLLGLGHVNAGDKNTFFVVADSSEAAMYRQNLLLPAKDFHVTLGFNPSDIYGVSKGRDTLVK